MPAGAMVVSQNLPCPHWSSVLQPHQFEGMQTGLFSGVQMLEFVAEHCVHDPSG
jgi:hypothetical protein